MKELKLVKLAVKAEDAAAKREVQKITGRRKRDEMCDESGSELSDMDTDMPTKKKKRLLTTIDKWQQGHRAVALAAAEAKTVERVTVRSWAEACEKLREYGFAVVDDFVDLFHPDCAPNREQRDYMYNRKFYSYSWYASMLHVITLICYSSTSCKSQKTAKRKFLKLRLLGMIPHL